MSFSEWLVERELSVEDITGRKEDLQAAAIFPVVEDKEQMGTVLRWMVSEPGLTEGKAVWLESRRLSADEISAQATCVCCMHSGRASAKETGKCWHATMQRVYSINST